MTREKEIMKELSASAQWIGEDGAAACVSSTKLGALRKFRRLMRDDVGDLEARDMKMEDIGIGYLFVITEEMKKDEDAPYWYEETDWYVDFSKESPHEVWVYNAY